MGKVVGDTDDFVKWRVKPEQEGKGIIVSVVAVFTVDELGSTRPCL
jgi:hypothetical protein